ncbi:antA/AntB antirepressor family protein [Lactococcus garvieae]|uniref:Phage anti-repressor protein n=1 Tax=Lactococcus garvieae TaxID=1363 RepID=A0A1I4HBC9_9LACT|nr:antA/AntB antirepressor family protein [Lactococcus garvieae]SFL39568.1 Phage anti-repressor protein [Lactococcus garvieae]
MELIKIETNARDEQIVSARELYKALGVRKRFSDWWKQNSRYLVENEDFTGVPGGTPVKGGNGSVQYLQDYVVTADNAKHLAMQSQTKKSREIRDYFIRVEKEYNEKLRLGCTGNRPSLGDIFKKNNEIARVLVANGVSRRTVMKAVLAKTQADSGEDLTPFLSILDEMPDRLTSEQAILNSKEQWNNG